MWIKTNLIYKDYGYFCQGIYYLFKHYFQFLFIDNMLNYVIVLSVSFYICISDIRVFLHHFFLLTFNFWQIIILLIRLVYSIRYSCCYSNRYRKNFPGVYDLICIRNGDSCEIISSLWRDILCFSRKICFWSLGSLSISLASNGDSFSTEKFSIESQLLLPAKKNENKFFTIDRRDISSK